MRRSPRAVVAWLLAAGLALLTARTVANDVGRLHRQARASGPLVPVVVARRDLGLGHVVTAGDVTRHRYFRADRPAGGVADIGDVVGKVVRVPVLAGSPVLRAAVEDRRAGVVQPGTRVVRVPTDDGLHPEPGSVVDVLATLAGGTEPSIVVARGAVVVDGGGSSGALLLVPEAAAARIAFAVANGTVTLVLAPFESACCNDDT